MSEQSDSETERIHFLEEVEDCGAAYRCLRCRHATSTKVEMKEHRDGVISPCFRTRMVCLLRSVWPGTGGQNDE